MTTNLLVMYGKSCRWGLCRLRIYESIRIFMRCKQKMGEIQKTLNFSYKLKKCNYNFAELPWRTRVYTKKLSWLNQSKKKLTIGSYIRANTIYSFNNLWFYSSFQFLDELNAICLSSWTTGVFYQFYCCLRFKCSENLSFTEMSFFFTENTFLISKNR